ncbi:50S ribosomal protein L22 [Candidatus Nomurabacteria bacterium]|nr:50S ribosomal protein L22 [Candidatus Nomurabacteria bacterium]
MKASLKHYRQSPRKVRLVANAVKGKSVPHADAVLSFMPKRAAEPVRKLIASAAANAIVQGADADRLIVKNVEVNKGLVMRRFMPRAQGSAKPINKRTSHVLVTLAEAASKEKRTKKASAKKQ